MQRTELLALLAALSVLPLASRGRVVVLPIVGTAFLSAGLFWLARAGVPLFRPRELAPPGAVALVLLGAWMRIGLFPFHGYVPVLFERSHPSKAAVAFVANPGMLILMRVLTESAWDLGISGKVLMVVAAISGLYAAFLCIGQSDLLRAVGFQAVASTSMIVAGLCSREEAGAFGAILHATGSGLFVTGLALVAWGVKARLGTSPGTATPGIASAAPHAAAAFLLFGLAAAGFPGTLGFVSEELLLHGVIEHHPVTGTLIVLTTALSAIAMLRLFFLVFYGAPNTRGRSAAFAPTVPIDLFPREKLAFGALLVVIFGLGVMPAPALSILHSVTDNSALHHQQSGETP
ncbi:MAG: hypothetical protein IPK82_00930 [Polyangiaceae bacterium]|nr:hypothetical protein [Polyangiaceae bacterium]